MTKHVSQRAARQWLADWQSAGVTGIESTGPLATGSGVLPSSTDEDAEQSVTEVTVVPLVAAPAQESTQTQQGLDHSSLRKEVTVAAEVLSRPEREAVLQTLAQTVSECQRCSELAQTRTQTVFGVGNPEARVMFIGEAPGADEDAQGEPFVGRAGQLLNKIIEACGWKREEIYICNILRCRPPGNRNPTPEEAANCREYLDGQIRVVNPEYIVCWGSVAAHNLLDETTSIGKLRQRWMKYGPAKVLCTYHPSYLLRNPAAKKPVWEDMKFLMADMGLTPPSG